MIDRVHCNKDGFEDNKAILAATKKLLPTCSVGELPTDPKHLDNMFLMCVTNWKTYKGPNPGKDKRARINAVYKQATQGDCNKADWNTDFEKKVLDLWRGYAGTPTSMAKRRFLSLLREVDIRLLLVKPYHAVPLGFPRAETGEPICPYSNSKIGCPRPVMDKYGHVLEHELENNPALADYVRLKEWLDKVTTEQRCSLGLHRPITPKQGLCFKSFYMRPECSGFQPCIVTGTFIKMIKKVLERQFLLLVEMQENFTSFSEDAILLQRDRVLGLKSYYTSTAGINFNYEVACTRTSTQCHQRRLADGKNHNHAVVVQMPPVDLSVYDHTLEVRRECERLGLSPMTGPVVTIDHRVELMQLKIVEFHRRKMLVYESQRRQQWYNGIAPHNLTLLRSFSRQHLVDCLKKALNDHNIDQVCRQVEVGADPATEVFSGLFPLMLAVWKRSSVAIQRLLKAGADVDQDNSHGMTALMWAVKRNDYTMTEALLEAKVDVPLEGQRGWTAMAVAAHHGRLEMVEFLIESMLASDKVAGQMNVDRALNHRSTVNGGLTPAMIAARHRNEAMVRLLLRKGANPRVRCYKGYHAGEHAVQAGWKVLGQWLQETEAFGADGVYTYADMQREKQLWVESAQMVEAISSGAIIEKHRVNLVDDEGVEGENDVATEIEKNASWVVLLKDTLHQASQQGEGLPKTVEILKAGQAAPDTETDVGHTALISASYRGLENAVRLLIQEGADPSYSNRNGRSALMAAAAAGHYKVIRLLLLEGANASAIDVYGKAASSYAFEKGFEELARLLALAVAHGNETALKCHFDRAYKSKTEARETCIQAVREKTEGEKRGEKVNNLMPDMRRRWEDAEGHTTKAEPVGKSPRSTQVGRLQPELCASEMGKGAHLSAVRGNNTGQTTEDKPRCPKCTLVIPCAHFESLLRLQLEFPEGVPEWRWNKRQVITKVRNQRQRGPMMKKATWEGETAGNRKKGGGEIPWWKILLQAHQEINRHPGRPQGNPLEKKMLK